MQPLYLALVVICGSYMVAASSLPEYHYDNQMQQMDEQESFPIPPPDDYQRDFFLFRQAKAEQSLSSAMEGSIFDVSNDVEDGSTLDELSQRLRGRNIEAKVAILDVRLKDLNIQVLENTLKLLRMQQGKGDWKGRLDRQSGTIRNISDSVRHLEELLMSQANPHAITRLQEQAGILENLTETLKEAVVISQQNEEEIATLKQAQRERFGFAIGHLDEQAVLTKDIQRDIAVIQLSGDINKEDTDGWRHHVGRGGLDVSQSVLDMQRRIGQVERLVAVIREEVGDIEDDLKDDIEENKEKLYEQGIDMVHMTYDVHRIEGDLQEFTEDHDDVIDDIRHSITRLTTENKDQWVDIDTLDDTVENLQKYCCEDNIETVNTQISRVKSDMSQFRSAMDECLADITSQIKGINLQLGDFKAESDNLRTRLAYLEDKVKIEEMKREQGEHHYSTLFQNANSALASLQDKHSFDVVGVKTSVDNLLDMQQGNGEEFAEVRTKIEYLEREDLGLGDEIRDIQDGILKLTESIRHSADANRNFLQRLIHDLLNDRQ